MRLGLALPSFVDDPGIPVEVARAAEAVGIDGVFVYDHLFRRAADGSRRPALESVALLGALAAATEHVTIGALVFRSSLRPPATLGATVETIAKLAPGRVTVGIGAGDSESFEENETFGLGLHTMPERVIRLEQAVRATRDRGATVWVGGLVGAVREIAAAEADGWNAWGVPVERFEVGASRLRSAAARSPFECTWAGLVVVDDSDATASDKAARLGAPPGTVVGGPERVAAALRSYRDVGADWAVVAPVDSRDPANATRLGARVAPILKG